MHADNERLNDLSGRIFGCAVAADVLLVVLKTVKAQDDAHRSQCANYPKATNLQLCLLLNFGKPHLAINRVANPL